MTKDVKNDNSSNSKEKELEKDLDSKKADDVSPSIDEPTESKGDFAKNKSDEVAKRMEDFNKKTPASNNSKFKKRRHRGKKREKGNDSSKTIESSTKPTVASSTTPVVINKRTNVQNSQTDDTYYESSGWIEGAFDGDFFNRLNAIFESLGIDTTDILDRRGELLRGFKKWTKINAAWVNGSKDVYVLDIGAVDRSLSSEMLWYRLYRQRRPFAVLSSGIVSVSAHVAPDEIKKFKFLNVTTNGQPGNTVNMYAKFASYGTLEQSLDATDGSYQNRNISLTTSSVVNSKPGSLQGFRIPSTNQNIIQADGSINNDRAQGSQLDQFQVNLSTNTDKQMPYDIGTSVELKNKGATLIKMLTKIRELSAEYAHNSKDGDNDWYEPISLIEDVETLAATINGPADLKTFLYIMNDAIKGAFDSQLVKATKLGVPDSSYISLTEKSRGIAETFDSAFLPIWDALRYSNA